MAQNKALYTFGKGLLMPFYKLLYRYKVKNKGSIPAEGGVILASNHLSFADPVLLGLCEKRRLYFMAKKELFRNKFAAAVIRALGAFPVERGAGDGGEHQKPDRGGVFLLAPVPPHLFHPRRRSADHSDSGQVKGAGIDEAAQPPGHGQAAGPVPGNRGGSIPRPGHI